MFWNQNIIFEVYCSKHIQVMISYDGKRFIDTKYALNDRSGDVGSFNNTFSVSCTNLYLFRFVW